MDKLGEGRENHSNARRQTNDAPALMIVHNRITVILASDISIQFSDLLL
jgi:hypothetical protein